MAGRKGGWVGGWVEAKAGLRIAYSNKKKLAGWKDGWVGGKAGLRIAYSNQKEKTYSSKKKVRKTALSANF